MVICSAPFFCSSQADAISDISCSMVRTASVTLSSAVPFSLTELMMLLSASPLLLTSLVPVSTLLMESVIISPISLAALAERWARLRTSPATTANPLPWSPALAASTAALSARRFVWKAISLMTVRISLIFLLDLLTSSIDITASTTTLPPSSAIWIACSEISLAFWTTRAVSPALRFASPALSAFCLVVAVDSSMVEATSSSDDACSVVRCERFSLPLDIWSTAWARFWDEIVISETILSRLSAESLSAFASMPSSSFWSRSIRSLKSPAAIFCAKSSPFLTGPVIVRAMTRVNPAPTITAITRIVIDSITVLRPSWRNSAFRCCAVWFCIPMSFSVTSLIFRYSSAHCSR